MTLDIQKINWKFFFDEKHSNLNPDDFFRVFNTWIPQSPEIFVDVVDYKHIQGGPITLLAGYHADFVFDDLFNQKGLLYNHKSFEEGDNQAKLTKSWDTAIKGCQRLLTAQKFANQKYNSNKVLFIINDRALAPNTADTREKVKKALNDFFLTQQLEVEKYEFEEDSKSRLTVQIYFANSISFS